MSEFFAATEHRPVILTGDRIRALRREAGLTQAELAERVDVSEDTIRGWEHERSYPGSTEAVIRLVRVLQPKPEPREQTQLLPPRYVELSADRTLAVRRQRGSPPQIFFTTWLPVLEEP